MKPRQFGMLALALTMASCKSTSESAIKPSELEGNWIYHLKIDEYRFNSAFHFNGKEVIFTKSGESIPLTLDQSGLLLVRKSYSSSYTLGKLKKINRDLCFICSPEGETENFDFIMRNVYFGKIDFSKVKTISPLTTLT